MGQEISQQTKCNGIRRPQQLQQHNNHHQHHHHSHQPITNHQNCQDATNSNNKINGKQPKELIYTPASISSSISSTTDDEHYRQRQKYNLSKQTYEKTKVAKKLSFISTTTTATTASSSSDYQNCSISGESRTPTEHSYENIANISKSQLFLNGLRLRQRKHSQSSDSGIYYSTCHCSSESSTSSSARSSSASSTSEFPASVISTRSSKSLDKQKHYLSHHLYIKSYLDILEEDEKARAHFKSARPGGIRNYKPKILADASVPVTLGSSSSNSTSTSNNSSSSNKHHQLQQSQDKQRIDSNGNKLTEDPWI